MSSSQSNELSHELSKLWQGACGDLDWLAIKLVERGWRKEPQEPQDPKLKKSQLDIHKLVYE